MATKRKLPYRVELNKQARLCPWNVIGPEGLVSGHSDKADAQRTAKKLNAQALQKRS